MVVYLMQLSSSFHHSVLDGLDNYLIILYRLLIYLAVLSKSKVGISELP